MNNLVSIITPSFNSERFICSCVESVILQTYSNWEMIIIDDFSTDNSKDKISRLCEGDLRIKKIFLDVNVGSAEARNIGIRSAKGKYIAFLDSDDLWDSSKLEKQIAFMSDNNLAFSFTSYRSIYEDSNKVINIFNAPKTVSYDQYLKNTIIGCLTVVIDRQITGEFEMPNIRSSHDMALWLIIMKRGFSAYGLNDNLARYRIVSSSNTSNKLKAAYDVWKVYRKIEGLSFLYSCYCFLNYIINALKKRII